MFSTLLSLLYGATLNLPDNSAPSATSAGAAFTIQSQSNPSQLAAQSQILCGRGPYDPQIPRPEVLLTTKYDIP
jgi:hypothetical protein